MTMNEALPDNTMTARMRGTLVEWLLVITGPVLRSWIRF
jgi:hypothetical protein